eukprot:s2095_g15.t1
MVTDQNLEPQSRAKRAWLCEPKVNRALLFNGSLLHGVIPNLASASESQEPRTTLMLGLWGRQPCCSPPPEVPGGELGPFWTPFLLEYIQRLPEKGFDWPSSLQAAESLAKCPRLEVSPVNLAGPVSPVWCSVPQPSEPSSCSVDFIGKWFLREAPEELQRMAPPEVEAVQGGAMTPAPGILARGTPVCQLWLNGLPYGARGRGVSWQIAGLGNGCGMFSRLRWRKLGKRCQIRNSSSKHPKVQSARLIAEAGAHSNWPQALHLWKTCKDIPGSADATIKALGRGVQWERAAEFLSNQMASSAGHGVTLLAVAEATAWRHCLSILSTMQLRRVDATPTSLNATIVSCGRRFMWQSALNLLFAYEQQASHQPIVTADCAMAVLTALQVAHQWEQAIAMISTLPDPNESHMTAVVEACKRSHAWEASLRFLGTTIDQNACDAAMRACAISSEWQATLSLLSRHTEPEPSGVSTALSALAKAMQWQRAIHLFNQTQMLWTLKPENRKVRKGKEDGESWEIIKDRSLLRALGAGHLWEDALFHFQSANAQDAWNLSAAIWACQVAEQSVARELLSEHLRQHQRRRSKRKELRVLEHLSQLSDPDAVQILASIEDFSKENRWLKVAGGEKGQILESVIRPGERVLEVGSYIGFTALRLAQHGCEVVTIEADPLNAAVAQEIVEMASMASMDTMGGGSPMTSRVKICVGRATDWLSSGLLDPVDVILLDHRGTIYHEERCWEVEER